ncbi:MAG: hypothetical protein KC553_11830 [Nitrospina sp.]|nr:hypothetical protein [Nitrospina sp.]
MHKSIAGIALGLILFPIAAGAGEITFDVDMGGPQATIDSNGLTLSSGTNANEFSTDGTLAGDSDNAVPTEKAVKTYVDNSTGTLIVNMPDFSSPSETTAPSVSAIKDFVDNHSSRNLLVNGGFRIAQRGTTFDASTTSPNDDNENILDRWVLISNGNDIVDITQESSDVPTGAHNAIKFNVQTADKQFGIFQALSSVDSSIIIGGKASLRFDAKTASGALSNVRAEVVCWAGTADGTGSPARIPDPIGTWAGGGTNPTLATNFTAENTGSDLGLSDSYQTFAIENISIDTASCNNVGVIIWVDDTTISTGSLLYISNIHLNKGETSTPANPRLRSEELLLAQTFFYSLGSSDYAYNAVGLVDGGSGGGAVYVTMPVEMYKAPLPSFIGNYHFKYGDTFSTALSSIASTTTGTRVVTVSGYPSGSLSSGQHYVLRANNDTSARFHFDAEIQGN